MSNAPASETQKTAQEELDEAILERIREARKDPERRLSAAEVKAFTERFKDVQPVTLPGSTRDKIAENIRLANYNTPLPPLDEEQDDAATA